MIRGIYKFQSVLKIKKTRNFSESIFRFQKLVFKAGQFYVDYFLARL